MTAHAVREFFSADRHSPSPPGDLPEFGVVRIGGEFAEPCDYVFTVHALIESRDISALLKASGRGA